MKTITGPKQRVIKANDVAINSSFAFNKSINPRGGKNASIFVSKTKRGFGLVQLYQDLNDDGIVSRKELIYRGKSLNRGIGDELLNFTGDIKLIKTMHRCDWISLKNPGLNILCTREFIPTTYELTLSDTSGENYQFDALGKFKTSGPLIAIEPT